MFILERISKSAATTSVLLIASLLLWLHPDLTPKLTALTIAAIAVGIAVPASLRGWTDVFWIASAMLSPAVLRLLVEREGPVLDLFWMAGLSASLLRYTSWSQWRLPARWRVFAGGWALTLSLVWPVLLAREAGFDARVLTDGGAINSWGMLSAPQVAAWLLYVVWTQLLGLLWLEWAYQRFEASPTRVPWVMHGVWIGATIASVVGVYQGTFDLTMLSTPFWASRARATGTLLDANAFGMCAALAGPLAFLALHQWSRTRETDLPRSPALERTSARTRAAFNALAFLVFVVNLAGLWMSGSRVATLCAVAATSVFIVAVWSSLDLRARRTLPSVAIGAIALIVIVVAASNAIGPARRVAEIPASLRSGLSTIFDRVPYGPIATQMVRDHPLVGIGVSSYQILAPDYQRMLANNRLPFDNAQNWWRHQLAEFGVAGSALLFLWSALIAWQIVTARHRPEHRLEATIVRGLVAAVGVSSWIQVPTQTPIVMLSFMLLLGWAAALVETGGTSERLQKWGWAIATVLAIAYAGGQLVLARGPLAVVTRAEHAEREFAVGTYPPESSPEVATFRWTRGNARFVWPTPTPWLVIRVWAEHPDIRTQPVRVTLNTPCGVLMDEELTTKASISIGVTLPEGQKVLEGRLSVSRTWRPSDYGSNDERVLGAAIVAQSLTDQASVTAQHRVVTLKSCGPGI